MNIFQILRSLKWQLIEKPFGVLVLLLWKEPKVYDLFDSLDELLSSNKSLCRLGNGEFGVIWGGRIGFQGPNKKLGDRLREIVRSKQDNIMIAINDYSYDEKKSKTARYKRPREKAFAYVWRHQHALKFARLLESNRSYYEANVSRPYTMYEGIDHGDYFARLKKLWADRDVYIVEGVKTRLGVGNDLFDNCKSLHRIIGPAENAFDKYDVILERIVSIVPKSALLIMAMGPTATILAYDLSQLGYRAIDIGHVDIEYEYFLRKAQDKIKIPGKYVNEVSGGAQVDDTITDKAYSESIVCRID